MVGPEEHENDGAVDWPTCENVLRSLSEYVRPIGAAAAVGRDDERVATDVRLCLAEPVAPYEPMTDGPTTSGPTTSGPLRLRQRRLPQDAAEAAVVAEASRTQTRAMAVRSAYVDGKYYASDASHASRTVEELSLCWRPSTDPDGCNTYTVGTVLYDADTGECRLHGLTDPRRSVAVDCGLLTDRLPRHQSTVKMYSELRGRVDGQTGDDDGGGALVPVLVPHHFHVFRHRRWPDANE